MQQPVNREEDSKDEVDHNGSGSKESVFRRKVLEEKRLREMAQQQMVHTRELLKRSEAKAKLLRAKLRLAEQIQAAPSEPLLSDTDADSILIEVHSDNLRGKAVQREGSGKQLVKPKDSASMSKLLPSIAGNILPRSVPGPTQQAALIALEKVDPAVQHKRSATASGMADAIIRTVDLGDDQEVVSGDEKEIDVGEQDDTALLEFKNMGNVPRDLWNDDLTKVNIPIYVSECEVIKVSTIF